MTKDWLIKQVVEKLFLGLIASLLLALAVFLMERESSRQAEASMANEARIAVTSQLFLRLSGALIETIDILRADQRSMFEGESREAKVEQLIAEQASIVIAMETAFENDDTLSDWLEQCARIYKTTLHRTNLPIENINSSKAAIAEVGKCHSNAAISLSDRLRDEIIRNNQSLGFAWTWLRWPVLSVFLIGMVSLFLWKFFTLEKP